MCTAALTSQAPSLPPIPGASSGIEQPGWSHQRHLPRWERRNRLLPLRNCQAGGAEEPTASSADRQRAVCPPYTSHRSQLLRIKKYKPRWTSRRSGQGVPLCAVAGSSELASEAWYAKSLATIASFPHLSTVQLKYILKGVREGQGPDVILDARLNHRSARPSNKQQHSQPAGTRCTVDIVLNLEERQFYYAY